MGHSLTFLDKTFWITESADNPKHVASLQLLSVPDSVDPSAYIDDLVNELRKFDNAIEPFNGRVVSLLGYPVKLKTVNPLNMHYHVQQHKVENVHDRVGLDDFIARMHETLLDRDKPLWQFHVLHDGKSQMYAIYIRVHHMYGDGFALVKWFQSGFLSHPKTEEFVPVWAVERKRHGRAPRPLWRRVGRGILNALHITRDLIVIFTRLLMKLTRINRHYMPVPFTGTRTVLTGQVKSGRAVATMDMDFARIQKLGKRCRASANEVLLCAIDIGVHRFLQDHGHTFKKALLTNMPINLRKPGEQTSGNKIAIVPVQLAHAESDPYLRLREIIYNHRIVKKNAQRANPGSFSAYTVIIQSMALLYEWCRLSNYVPPIANILISNVPGPTDTRYLKDSKLLANYPVSAITPGGGVNITLMTYNGQANIGFVCCNKHVKSLHSLALYVEDAFDVLERSINDPTLSIDDIGEHEDEVPVSIIHEELTPQVK